MLRTILVPLDGSLLSERALPYAAELARVAGARLTLVRVAGRHHRLHLGSPDEPPEDAADYLRVQAERWAQQGLVVDTAVPHGEPAEGLLAEIEQRQPDLVVMGTHGRSGIGRWVHGSVTEAVVSRGGRPVLLVRAWTFHDWSDTPRLRGKRVLVPLDGSAFAEAALPTATQLAAALGSEVLLFQAIVPVYPLSYVQELELAPQLVDEALWVTEDAEGTANAYLRGLADQLAARAPGLRVSTLARVGELTALIRELAAAAEAQEETPIGLVVMATHARSGLTRAVLGSEADAVLRGDDLPLVLVRPPDVESAPEQRLAVAAPGER